MSILNQLLSKGYFPKELPPAFSTESFSNVVTQATFNSGNCFVAPNKKGVLEQAKYSTSHLCKHYLARLDNTSRPLHLPHPTHFFYLCKELDNQWGVVDNCLKKSSLAISTPISDPNLLRAYTPSMPGSARPNRRVSDRAQGNVLLITDITNFYGTLYTHSISWALHTKAVAKQNRNDLNLLGNALDIYLRNGQDSQTSGIPIGPDTSFVIAEIVLSAIDAELQAKYPGLIGFRFYDDYEIVCEDELLARQVLSTLESLASEYELAVNQRKTKIVKLPDEIDHPWLTKLRQFTLTPCIESTNSNGHREQLIDFANLAFSLSKLYPNDPVLRYALAKASPIIQAKPFWSDYQNFLIQIYRSEPQLSHLIAGELIRYKQQGVNIDKLLLQKAIYSHISKYASTRATNEIAWALWIAILFEIELSDQIVAKLASISDNIVAILALDAQNKNLFKSAPDVSLWQSKLTESNIYSDDWLIAYEIAAKGWLPIRDGSDYLNNHQCFGELYSKGVKFYDEKSYCNIAAILKKLELNVDLYTT